MNISGFISTSVLLAVAALSLTMLTTSTRSDAASAGAANDSGSGFPADYRSLKLLAVKTGGTDAAIHTVYANERAAATLGVGQPPFPEGSLIIMEFANELRDGEGELVRERDGTPRRGEITQVAVMRRVPGFGTVYGENRAGEWQFSSFRADGSVLFAAENAAHCAACHRRAGAAKDYVYRMGGGPVPE